MKHKNSGFTLIELLIVISIISLLSSVIFSALNTARSKARDATRLKVAKEIKNAVELYRAHYGVYPLCGGTNQCSSVGQYGYISGLAVIPTYISRIPNDPLNWVGSYGYFYQRTYKKTGNNTFVSTGDANDYIFGMRLENGKTVADDYSGWGGYTLNYLDGN